MIKNTAGQKVGAQMVSATDGSAFSGSVTVSVTGDAGTQATGSVGSGACTHEGNGYHTYAPAQAETNYDLIAFTFAGTGAVPQTVQVYTRAIAPDVNLLQWLGSTPDALSSGKLPADVKLWLTVAPLALSSQLVRVSVGAIDDALLTAAKFASGAFDAVWSVATRTLTAFGFSTGLATQASVDDLPTNAELATALGTADDAVLAAIAALNNLSQANIRSAVGLGSANLDTQLAAIDTKTTNLPSDPADQSLIIAATTALASAIAALNNLSAAQVRTELSTELARIDVAVSTRAATGAAMTLTAGERNAIADAKFDRADAIETGVTERQATRLILAANAGPLDGPDAGAAGTVEIENAGPQDKTRITATVDEHGRRTAVTYDTT